MSMKVPRNSGVNVETVKKTASAVFFLHTEVRSADVYHLCGRKLH